MWLQEGEGLGDCKGYDPGKDEGVADGEDGPFPAAGFCLDGADCGNAREVDKSEDHKGKGYGRSKDICNDELSVNGVEHIHCADHYLFGRHSAQKGNAFLPVEAQRRKNWSYEVAYHCKIGMFQPCSRIRVAGREVAQGPDDKGSDKDNGSDLLQILLAFVPGISQKGFPGRNPVWRKLHHERSLV